MAKCKIIGLPKMKNGGNVNTHLQPVPRSQANVEAEVGETVFTNTGSDDMVEHFKISGKPHSQGGTPLDLADGSFIFSDKLKVTDPKLLQFFNEKGKKKTIAEIAEKYKVNNFKAVLQDENTDRLAKKTAELNMNNAVEKLSALAMLQESMKGMPNGVSKMFNPFMEKTKMSIEDILPTSELTSGIQRPQPQMMFGGNLPKYKEGGEWGEVDKNAKLQYDYILSLRNNDGFKEALKKEYDKVAASNESYGKNWIQHKDKLVRKTADEVFEDYLDFQKRNLMLKSHGKDVSSTSQMPDFVNGQRQVSNKDITKWTNDLGVPLPKMDDAVRQQLSFIAFEKLSENREQYKDLLGNTLQPFRAKLVGKTGEKGVNPSEARGLSLADGAYTNTTAGEISEFDPSKITQNTTPASNTPAVTEQKEEPYKWDPTKLAKINPNLNLPEAPFWTQDINAVNRALGNRLGIKKYENFVPGTNLEQADTAYYSPERAIAAINQQVKTGVDASTTFSGPQQQAANFAQMQGQAMDQVANVISDYADKNVGIFNQTEQYNTQLANQKAMQDAAMQKAAHDERVTLSQNYDNAIQAAKDRIVSAYNNALTNRGETQALNLRTPNYYTDPVTGLTVYKPGASPFTSTTQPINLGDEFTELKKQMPGVDDNVIAKMIIGKHSGKWTVEKSDGMITPDELD